MSGFNGRVKTDTLPNTSPPQETKLLKEVSTNQGWHILLAYKMICFVVTLNADGEKRK